MAKETWEKEVKDELKRLADLIDFVMTNYYEFYSNELDEKLEDVHYAIKDELMKKTVGKRKLREVI
jgi:hypothetical protein